MKSSPKVPNILAIEVQGQNKDLWKNLKPIFIKKIAAFMAFEINTEQKRTVRDEFRSYASKALEYGKAKLDKATIENEALRAEVEHKFAQAQREFAEARERHALARKAEVEAAEAEFISQLKMMRVSLVGLKAMIIENSSEEDEIILSSDLEAYLIMIRAMEQEFYRS